MGPKGMRMGSGEGFTIWNFIVCTKPRRLRLAGFVARMEEDRSALIILTGKPTGKRHLGRSMSRCEDGEDKMVRESN